MPPRSAPLTAWPGTLVPALIGSLLALAVASTAGARAGGDVCDDVGYTFYVIAKYKERGDTREQQIEQIRASTRGASEATREHLLRVVDLVYRSDASARDLGTAVTRSCTVDENGKAVVRMFWPKDSASAQ